MSQTTALRPLRQVGLVLRPDLSLQHPLLERLCYHLAEVGCQWRCFAAPTATETSGTGETSETLAISNEKNEKTGKPRSKACDNKKTFEEFSQDLDLIISIGGDGTLLGVARLLLEQQKSIPILGIHLGRLGFLVDIAAEQLGQELPPLLNGHGRLETRWLLEVIVAGKRYFVLNDAVLRVKSEVRLIAFSLYADSRFVHHQRADGLVVATPTGSTAYALSAGGPIVHPGLAGILVAPICPHTLSSRPLMLPNHCSLSIVLSEESRSPAVLSCDGQINLDLEAPQRIEIRKADFPIQLLHPLSYDYFFTLRHKLGWQEYPKYER